MLLHKVDSVSSDYQLEINTKKTKVMAVTKVSKQLDIRYRVGPSAATLSLFQLVAVKSGWRKARRDKSGWPRCHIKMSPHEKSA